ncbi:MAG: pseudouridine-5'-phosphate glycosidase, partial [Candidatus Caccosoma sp.]|nr:pseudouridine-5'-phosphate glycosidase [Candidatus Caccosoma sp.]
ITPFLLKKIVEETKGESLRANIDLIYNNAKIGAIIAREYCKLK